MINLLICYFFIGIIIGIIEHYRWDNFFMGGVVETLNRFFRIFLAWPTYIIEEFMFYFEEKDL